MSSLIHKLKADYPTITFFETDQYMWSPTNRTVSYNPDAPHASQLLLHELSHGLLDHRDYHRDIELLSLETAAWEKAAQLAATYTVRMNDEVTQTHLDTYRDWMHARSTCPECSATGYQTAKDTYACPACSHEWRVNEARLCGLKRSRTQKTLR